MKNSAAQALGKLSVKKSPKTHSKEHMLKLLEIRKKKKETKNNSLLK